MPAKACLGKNLLLMLWGSCGPGTSVAWRHSTPWSCHGLANFKGALCHGFIFAKRCSLRTFLFVGSLLIGTFDQRKYFFSPCVLMVVLTSSTQAGKSSSLHSRLCPLTCNSFTSTCQALLSRWASISCFLVWGNCVFNTPVARQSLDLALCSLGLT